MGPRKSIEVSLMTIFVIAQMVQTNQVHLQGLPIQEGYPGGGAQAHDNTFTARLVDVINRGNGNEKQWEKFEDKYKTMLFANGDKCWNGPDRSLKVKLRCGLKNEVTDVDEPSRCEYVTLLSTPSVCSEDKLKELQDKLDALNREQPAAHDEL